MARVIDYMQLMRTPCMDCDIDGYYHLVSSKARDKYDDGTPCGNNIVLRKLVCPDI